MRVDMSTGFPVPLGYVPDRSTPTSPGSAIWGSTPQWQRFPAIQQPATQQQQQQQPRLPQHQSRQASQASVLDAGPVPPCDWGLQPTGDPPRPPASLRPAFRAHPRNVQRRGVADTQARILFVDEGNQCRCAPPPPSLSPSALHTAACPLPAAADIA